MLRIVLSSALSANRISCRTAKKTMAPTARSGECQPSTWTTSRPGSGPPLAKMPSATVFRRTAATPAEAAGITPATAVAAKSPTVVLGLACQTRPRTRGSAAVVPLTDSLIDFQRPRRSFGPSGSWSGSIVGSPVRPLLASPPCSGLRRRPCQKKTVGGPPDGGIMPMRTRSLPGRRDQFRTSIAM